jgi:hypothetical protein
MYDQILRTSSDTLARVGAAYEDANRPDDLGFYYLLLHEATLAAMRDERPPAEAEGINAHYIDWLEKGRDLLLERLSGEAAPPSEGAYDDATVALFEEFGRVMGMPSTAAGQA